jgi:hypothetical protein
MASSCSSVSASGEGMATHIGESAAMVKAGPARALFPAGAYGSAVDGPIPYVAAPQPFGDCFQKRSRIGRHKLLGCRYMAVICSSAIGADMAGNIGLS